MASKFVPRTTFQVSQDIPRSYFLGHHSTAMKDMQKMLSSVDAVIECRDFRIPHTSINPLFEEALGNKQRAIIYTKRELGGNYKLPMQQVEKTLLKWNKGLVAFVQEMRRKNAVPLLKKIRKLDLGQVNPFTGCRILVVGLPNVGKSTLINALRAATVPVGKNAEQKKAAKAAQTGDQPGVTRRVGGPVRLFSRRDSWVYLYDTPGVFLPQVPDAETMVKLALCGTVKDSVISRRTLVDYILYHTNRIKPFWYRKFCEPTNDVDEFLTAVALKSGCLARGGVPDLDRACSRILNLYHSGEIPGFVMDDVVEIHKQKLAARSAEREKAKQQAIEAENAEKSTDAVEHQADVGTAQAEGTMGNNS